MTAHHLLKKIFKYNFRQYDGIDFHEYHSDVSYICFGISKEKLGFSSVSKVKGTHSFVDKSVIEIAYQWMEEYEQGLYGKKGENIDKISENKQEDKKNQN